MVKTNKTTSNIAIIGGGLVGSLAALCFAKEGHEVEVFEYRQDIRETELVVGRSINLALSQRGRRALYEVGLEDVVLETAIPMKGRMLHDVKGKTSIVLYDPCNMQCLYSVGRKQINEVLLNAGVKYPNLKYHFETKLVESDLMEGNMEFKDMKSGEQYSKSADLIVGCDGAFSSLRQKMVKTPGFNFSQEYIEHGYLELSIPAKDGKFQMPENYLHIWPRDIFMMIALPNQDKSFTVTLFMPFKVFESIKTESDIINFFKTNYPDAYPLMGKERLVKEFFQIKPQHLISIKCNPYNVGSKAVLIGDAAHAMVPFYGQGMNCGLEDCRMLTTILENADGNIAEALQKYSESRCKDAHAICDLAMYNYVEMRDLTKNFSFKVRKWLDNLLFKMFPNYWIPLYNSVSFSDMPYSECTSNRQWQDQVLKYFSIGLFIALASIMMYHVFSH